MKIIKLIKKIKSHLNLCFILLFTIFRFCLSKKIVTTSIENFTIRGGNLKDLSQISRLYSNLNNCFLSKRDTILLRILSEKLILICEYNKHIIGIDLYYLNRKDFMDNTVHEGFIGVIPEYQGQGIATIMRQQAIKHFKKNGLAGISTRISKNNLGSLHSAEKLGFKPVEEYYDEAMGEERYYLVCKF